MRGRVETQINQTDASFVQFSCVPFSFQVRFGTLGVSIVRPYDTSVVHLSVSYWHQRAGQFSSLFAVYQLVRRSVNFYLLPKPIELHAASSMRIWHTYPRAAASEDEGRLSRAYGPMNWGYLSRKLSLSCHRCSALLRYSQRGVDL